MFTIVDLYTKLEKIEKRLKEKDTTNVWVYTSS